MPLPQPLPGLVIHYAYLWHDQHERGIEEGIKDRPCVIVSSKTLADGGKMITLLPITHRPPQHPADAIELPAATKRRFGMDRERSWIILHDLNRFRWPGPDVRPVPGRTGVYAYGLLPFTLFQQMRNGVLVSAERHRVKLTSR